MVPRGERECTLDVNDHKHFRLMLAVRYFFSLYDFLRRAVDVIALISVPWRHAVYESASRPRPAARTSRAALSNSHMAH